MKESKSVGILTVVSAVGGVVAVLHSVVVARIFGTGAEIAVFFGASTLLALMFSLTQAGQLGELFLPAYHRVKGDRGKEGAHEAFSVVLNWTVVALVGLSAVLFLSTPTLVRLLLPGFESEQQDLGAMLFYPLIPLISFQVLISLVHTVANAERLYGKPELLGVIGRIGGVVAIAVMASRFGVWAMVGATWVAYVVQATGYVWLLHSIGYRHRMSLSSEGFDHWKLFRAMGHSFVYVGSTQVWGFALTAALSNLPTSVFAVFKYAKQLHSKTRGILMRPISIVFHTGFSEAVARRLGGERNIGRGALDHALLVCTFAVVTIALCGSPLLEALWGGEKFDSEQISLAATLLTIFFGLMIVAILGNISRKAALSLGQIRSQYLGPAVVQLVCAAVALPLVKHAGVYGAVGAVGLNILGLGLVPVFLFRARFGWTFWYSGRKLALWTLTGTIVVSAGFVLLTLNPAGHLLVDGRLGQLIWAFVMATFSASSLALVSAALGIEETRRLWRYVSARFRVKHSGTS